MPQIIGDRGLDNGVLEYKCRRSGEKQKVAIDDIAALLKGKSGRYYRRHAARKKRAHGALFVVCLPGRRDEAGLTRCDR
ncbi:hypothetical protein KW821_17990 [Aeromonas sp. sif2416]|nr:hypothetical protein [Aeromonas sp. sif2416]MBV7439112.1 hypothetical protein [Aeromonas sp. sif2416]